MSDDTNVSYQYVPWRGVTAATMQAFGVQTKVSADGTPLAIAFPYGDIAKKIRTIEGKKFHSVGNMSDATLFGKDKFSAGSAKSITIVEGELDALSVFQMLGSKYPVVSVRSASSARQDCSKERDYLNSFERIYVCLDNDEPGVKATREIAGLFDFNKVYHVKLTGHKDANEYLSLGKSEEFSRVWWNAKRFLPEGIVSSFDDFQAIISKDHSKEGIPYPFPRLTELTYGLRTGEVVLITALEGRGKTEMVRAIEYHLLKNTDDNIGIIHLEESKARLLKGLAGYELDQPVHLPTSSISDEEITSAIQKLVGRDDRLHLYSHFGSTDPDAILDAIRFLVAGCGCKYVFFDHITMAVSGLGDKDERVLLDYISTRLGMMVEELDFALILVSHVNDDNKTRGSRNISKIADLWIDLNRDLEAPTEEERNITQVMIKKNRFGARTGPSNPLYFNLDTFKVTEKSTEFGNGTIGFLPPA